ncbi:hypothetical protein FMEAI12_4810005 [Parafrankia sp. Ea1.12]|nr:hypothetical protein FMEAI12_4810005 [Parafrankia sp. Ea1.12]
MTVCEHRPHTHPLASDRQSHKEWVCGHDYSADLLVSTDMGPNRRPRERRGTATDVVAAPWPVA